MELAPLLVVVPRVVRAHAEAVPHRQRRLVTGDDRTRGVLRALRAVFVLEEQQVALAGRELELLLNSRRWKHRRAALFCGLAVDECCSYAFPLLSSAAVGVGFVFKPAGTASHPWRGT